MKCPTCGKVEVIERGFPFGNECEECRKKTGNCRICGVNVNDCCC